MAHPAPALDSAGAAHADPLPLAKATVVDPTLGPSATARRDERVVAGGAALARAASNNCQGRLIVNAMGCGVRIESMQREGLDETFGIVGVPIVGVGVGGDFEGGEIDLISQQTADAAETTAKLVTLLRLIRDEFQDATKLLVLVC